MIESKKPRKKHKFFKAILTLGLFLVLAGGFFYLTVFSSVFLLNKINIQGAAGMDMKPIDDIILNSLNKKILFGKIPVNNPIFFPDKEILQAIDSSSLRISSAAIKTDILKHTVLISIEQRKPSAIWCRVASSTVSSAAIFDSTTTESIVPLMTDVASAPEVENCFFVDSNGFIYETAPIISGGALATVYQQSNEEIRPGENVSNQKMLEFILATKKALSSININLTDFVIESQSAGDLEILAPDGWRIYLDTAQSPESQVSVLRRVLDDEIKEQRPRLDYIDLRVAGRVYYKLK